MKLRNWEINKNFLPFLLGLSLLLALPLEMCIFATACHWKSLLRYSLCLLPQLGNSLNLPEVLRNLAHDLLLLKLTLADWKICYDLLQLGITDFQLPARSGNLLRNSSICAFLFHPTLICYCWSSYKPTVPKFAQRIH